MGNALRQIPKQGWALNYQPAVFRDHVEWLLRNDVFDLRAAAAEGKDSVKPAWQSILRCELEIRREAMRRIKMSRPWLSVAGDRSQKQCPGTFKQRGKRRSQHRQRLTRRSKKAKERGKAKRKSRAQKQLKKATRNDSRYSRALKNDKDSLHAKHNGQTICNMFQSPEG